MYNIHMTHFAGIFTNTLAMNTVDTFLFDDNLVGVLTINLAGAKYYASRQNDMIIVKNSDNVIVYSRYDSGKNTYRISNPSLHDTSIINSFEEYYGDSE